MAQIKLPWQSKLVLLLVLPFAAADVVLQGQWWATNLAPPTEAIWTFGLSMILGLVAWKLRAATPWAAASGALIAACLTFSTTFMLDADYTHLRPWRTALVPLLVLMVLTSLATQVGRARKERLGTAEKRKGRSSSQVVANLGMATLLSNQVILMWLDQAGLLQSGLARVHGSSGVFWSMTLPFSLSLAALAEAAADTVSSEIGQVLGGQPRMITTLRKAEPGTDGAITLIGTVAGATAAVLVALAGALALSGGLEMFCVALAGAVFGLFFDSLLGATLERRGYLNNDAVNFLSTASAAAFALILLAMLPHPGVG